MSPPLHSSPLYVICDADACAAFGWSLLDFASACLDGGARVLQIRAKQAPAGWLLDMTQAIVERAQTQQAQVIVNDRADIAALTGAAGLHVGQGDLSPRAARAVVGDISVVGLSTHTPTELEQALHEPIDYVAIGPVFATATKDTGHEAVGVDRVAATSRIASSRRLPVVAIGGITIDRAAAVLDAGAASVAVIGDLFATGDPAARVREYLRRLTR